MELLHTLCHSDGLVDSLTYVVLSCLWLHVSNRADAWIDIHLGLQMQDWSLLKLRPGKLWSLDTSWALASNHFAVTTVFISHRVHGFLDIRLLVLVTQLLVAAMVIRAHRLWDNIQLWVGVEWLTLLGAGVRIVKMSIAVKLSWCLHGC